MWKLLVILIVMKLYARIYIFKYFYENLFSLSYESVIPQKLTKKTV